MKIVVTGGAGFIGSHFVQLTLEAKLFESPVTDIHIVDSLTYAADRIRLKEFQIDRRVSFSQIDITDYMGMCDVLDGADLCINFAAETHVDRSLLSPDIFLTTNVLGAFNVARVCQEKSIRLVHVSTDEVYGSIAEGAAEENSMLNPSSPYSASKASADMLLLANWKSFGLDISITRCTNNFGFHQNPEKLIPMAITRLARGLKVPIYGSGLQSRDWISVEDHCAGIALVAEKGRSGEIYNIGVGSPIANLDLVRAIISEMNLDEDMFEFVTDRAAHDFRYSVDASKTKHEFGWSPQRNIMSELPSLVAHYRVKI